MLTDRKMHSRKAKTPRVINIKIKDGKRGIYKRKFVNT